MSLVPLEQEIIDIIAEQLGEDKKENIRLDMSFIGDLQVDSLDLVEIIMAVEEKFGCSIPQEQAEKIKTVGNLVTYVSQHRKQA